MLIFGEALPPAPLSAHNNLGISLLYRTCKIKVGRRRGEAGGLCVEVLHRQVPPPPPAEHPGCAALGLTHIRCSDLGLTALWLGAMVAVYAVFFTVRGRGVVFGQLHNAPSTADGHLHEVGMSKRAKQYMNEHTYSQKYNRGTSTFSAVTTSCRFCRCCRIVLLLLFCCRGPPSTVLHASPAGSPGGATLHDTLAVQVLLPVFVPDCVGACAREYYAF